MTASTPWGATGDECHQHIAEMRNGRIVEEVLDMVLQEGEQITEDHRGASDQI